MSNKLGKFLFSSAVAGAAIYGVYSYLQNKEKAAAGPVDDTDDDFDDFNEDLDDDMLTDDPQPQKDRSYVSLNLDKAGAFATEAFYKAKEVLADSVAQVKETVKSVKENHVVAESSFTDLTAVQKEKAEEAAEEIKEMAENAKEAVADAASDAAETVKETVSETAGDAKETVAETISGIKESAPVQETVGKVEEFFDDSHS